jgi:uncharacterized protein (DUF1501 family)
MPHKIAPAKQAAREQAELAKAKAAAQTKQKRAYADAVVQQLESVAKAHQERRGGPSAMDPVLSRETPTQKAKGKSKKNKLVKLLKLSALAIMSHPFGAELASWDKGVAVDCGANWSKEAIDLAVEQGPHPTARAARRHRIPSQGGVH